MTAVTVTLPIEQGATFVKRLTWRDRAKRPIDLTGYRAHLQIRAAMGGPIAADLTTENGGIVLGGTAGTIAIRISAVITSEFKFTAGVYELRLIVDDVPDDPTEIRLMTGKVTVSPGVIEGA